MTEVGLEESSVGRSTGSIDALEDDEDARANLTIEDMALSAEDDALFDMLRDERVPPPLATQILLRLLGHPDADPALAITPADASF